MVKFTNILEKLKDVPGLNHLGFLKEKHKSIISQMEESNNLGVLECLKREHILLLSHNSYFRPPTSEIVKFQNNTSIFPSVPFPEVKAEDVVSSSPSLAVHNWLLNEFNISLNKEEATLLVGFNLK
jgi:hypothetical protein